jgi:flavin-dependent dehydrogenase
MQTSAQHDVVILGGGLAGLTLALQLKQAMPTLDIRVLERRTEAAPVSAHKIGESSVEIGAHYFAQTLGLQAHLDEAHLRKFGFRFFFSEGQADLASVTELGASRFLSTPSWQIDRGVFENFLFDEALRRGIHCELGMHVHRIGIDATDGHQIQAENRLGPVPQAQTIKAKWLVDATGRASLLKRQLDLAQPNVHQANAVWFRLNSRLDLDNWAQDADWQARCEPAARWMSTNHLCGEGYWLWLIPLASGAHSVGIVADAKTHPLAGMNTFDKAMDWIAQHQPCLHEVLDARRDTLMDFAFFRDFSYGCKQTFSAQRWALTGDAGLFLDPFYSPGSDFIAISNTYITALIQHDQAGESLRMPALFYGELFQSFYESTLSLYQDQYSLFGEPTVMPTKVLWDYTYYWGVLCQLFFQNRLTDRHALSALHEPLMRARRLNAAIQQFMRTWGEHSKQRRTQRAPSLADNPARMLDQASLPWFAELNRGLRDTLDDDQFHQRILDNIAQLEQLATEIVGAALSDLPGLQQVIPEGIEPSQAAKLLFPKAA